jgi:hypothetical protein
VSSAAETDVPVISNAVANTMIFLKKECIRFPLGFFVMHKPPRFLSSSSAIVFF